MIGTKKILLICLLTMFLIVSNVAAYDRYTYYYKNVTASSTYATYYADNIRDNDTTIGESWIPSNYPGTPNWWIQADFDTNYSKLVNEVSFFKNNTADPLTYPKRWVLDGSNGGTNWKRLIDNSTVDQPPWVDGWNNFTFYNQEYFRYYRFTITSGNGSGNYYEMQLSRNIIYPEPNWYPVGDSWVANTTDGYTLVMWNATGNHTFVTAGNLTHSKVEYLVIAGGAGGGGGESGAGDGSGGGGAGGMLNGTKYLTDDMNYELYVGAGGARATASSTYGGNGTNSTFNSDLVAWGGGSSREEAAGQPGGSGGGGGGSNGGSKAGGAGVFRQGYAGGASYASGYYRGGAGGGGAGNTGGVPSYNYHQGGVGAIGMISNITGVPTYYAGGGGGGSGGNGYGGGTSLWGGGGMGGCSGIFYQNCDVNGTPNTGGGAGGGGANNGAGANAGGGYGGSGVVILKFKSTSEDLVADFSQSANPSTFGQVVSFNDTTSGMPTGWLWDFGDGNTSTTRDATNVYGVAGVYAVTLNVTNASGAYNQITHSHTVVSSDYNVTEYSYAQASKTSSYEYYGAPANAFDNNYGTYWRTSGGQYIQLDYNATTNHTINQLGIGMRAPTIDWYTPREFYLLGSIDGGSNWTRLLDVNATTFPTMRPNSTNPSDTDRYFNFTNNESFRYYRFYPVYSMEEGYLSGHNTNNIMVAELHLRYVNYSFRNDPDWHIVNTINRSFTNAAYINQSAEMVGVLNDTEQQFIDDTITQDSPVTNWFWDFGDGTPVDTSQNPTHTFTRLGNYSVNLTTTVNGINNSNQKYIDVTSRFEVWGARPFSNKVTISASSWYGDPWNLNDYNPDTYWRSEGDGDTKRTFTWDYQTNPEVINTIMINFDGYNGYVPQGFTLNASNDGSNWTTLFDKFGNISHKVMPLASVTNEMRYYNFSNTQAYRYYRYTCLLNYASVRYNDGHSLILPEFDLIYSDPRNPKVDFDVSESITNRVDFWTSTGAGAERVTLMNGTTYRLNDTTVVGDGYPLTAYSWDIGNDGNIESTNSYYYFTPNATINGTIKLTVGDGVHQPQSKILYYTAVDAGFEPIYGDDNWCGASASSYSRSQPGDACDGSNENDWDNGWYTESYPDQWWQMDYGVDRYEKINTFHMRAMNSYSGSYPRTFMVAGSNNTTLFEPLYFGQLPYNRAIPIPVTSAVTTDMVNGFNFSFNNEGSYRYYRITANSTNTQQNYGGSRFAVSEFRLFYERPDTRLHADAYVDGDGFKGETVNEYRSYYNQTYTVMRNKSVTFHDLSSGNPNSFAWDVNGDGAIDFTTKNFTYTFPTEGIYYMRYQVSDSGGRTDTKYINVNVQDAIEYWYFWESPNATFVPAASGTNRGSPWYVYDASNHNDWDNGWYRTGAYPYGWIEASYGMDEPKVINQVRIRQASSYQDASPRQFLVVASNDHIHWDNLDTRLTNGNVLLRRNNGGGETNRWYVYNFTNDNAYVWYRLLLNTSTSSSSYFDYEISEMQWKYEDFTNVLDPSFYIVKDNFGNGRITNENLYERSLTAIGVGGYINNTNTVSGLVGETIQFKDTSLGSPTGWTWDFGDGTVSMLQNPTKKYDYVGVYNVTLTITKSGSVTKNITQKAIITDAIELAYVLSMLNSSAADTNGISSYGTTTGADAYIFDNSTSTTAGSSWVHNYPYDNGGLPTWVQVDYANVNVTNWEIINEVSIVANEQWYNAPRAFTVMASNDSSSWDTLMNRTNTYETFPEGLTTGAQKTYGFVNTVPYRYYRLAMLTTGYRTALAEASFRFHNASRYIESDFYINGSYYAYDDAVYNATFSRTVFKDQEVTFVDTSIGTGLSYTWNFNNDAFVDATTANANYTYSTAGVYKVTHNVTKEGRTSTKYAYINVVDATNGIEPAYGAHIGLPIDYSSTSRYAPSYYSSWYYYQVSDHSVSSQLGWTTDPPKWIVQDYGGGMSNLSAMWGWKYPAINRYVIKAYTEPHFMPVCWTITGSNNLVSWNVLDTRTDQLNWTPNEVRTYNFTNMQPYRYYNFSFLKRNDTVSNAAPARLPELNYFVTSAFISTSPPVSNYTRSPINISTYAGQVQFLDTTGVNGTGGAPATWYWMFGDGTTSTERNPSHWYSVQGTYMVNLTTTNAGGSSTSSSYPVRVLSDWDSQIKTWMQFNHTPTYDTGGNSWTATGGAKVLSADTQTGFGNASLYLDGSGDYISTSSALPGLSLGNNNVTIELWFKRDSTDTGIQALVSKTNLSDKAGYMLYLSNNKLNFRADNSEVDDLSQLRLTSNVTITDSNWHFATVQRDGSRWRLYLDGVVNDTETWANAVSSSTYALRVGKTDYSSPYYYKGYIDEFRIGTKMRWDNNTFQPPFNEYVSADQITTTVLPGSGFTTNISYGVAPLVVQFTDASTYDPTSWYWNFGDGNGTSPSTQNPVYTYVAPGSYTPILTAANDGGNSTSPYSAPSPIVVIAPVVANFTGSPVYGSSPVTVHFTDSSTGGPTSWYWTFGDGGTSSVQNPTHIYSTNGTFNVTLIASNIAGGSNMTRHNYIEVVYIPVATFTSNQTSGYFPATIQFYDNSTGMPTEWWWDFGDGGFSTEQNPIHTFISESTYAVSLRCSNYNGNSTYSYNYVITPAESSIKTQAVVINASTGCVYFVGVNEGPETNVWFEYGMNQTQTGGKKSFKTPNQSGVTGNFTFKQCGIPILPGKQYSVVAGGDVMGEYVYGANRSFSLAAPTPHVTTTYEDQVDTFVEDGLDPIQLLTYDMWQPYLGLMGGLFFGILIAFIFMNIAIKQRTIAMTIILLFLTGAAIWGLMPAAFIQIAQMLFIAGVAGLLYWLFMKRR